MRIYSINYTLRNKPAENYAVVAKAIQNSSGGNCLHCLDSYWLILHPGPASTIFNAIGTAFMKDDSLMVTEVGLDYAAYLPEVEREWLKTVFAQFQ